VILPMSLVVLGSLLTAFGVVHLRRRVDHPFLHTSGDVIGNYVMVVTAIYGIFAAFVIVNLWEQRNLAERNIIDETNALHGLFRVAKTLPQPQRGALLRGAHRYVAAVLEEEWPAMLKGDVHHLEIDYSHVDPLWAPLMSLEPRSERDKTLYSEAIRHCEDILMARRIRLLDSEKSLAVHLWIILIAGALINIAFMFMVGAEHAGAQALFTGMSTCLILLLIFAVADLQRPFKGEWRVTPEPFSVLRDRMDEVFQREFGAKMPPLKVTGLRRP